MRHEVMPLPLQHFSPAHSPHGQERADAVSPLPLLTGEEGFPPALLLSVLLCYPDIPRPTAAPLLPGWCSSREDWAGSRANRHLLVLLCQRGARCFTSICK